MGQPAGPSVNTRAISRTQSRSFSLVLHRSRLFSMNRSRHSAHVAHIVAAHSMRTSSARCHFALCASLAACAAPPSPDPDGSLADGSVAMDAVVATDAREPDAGDATPVGPDAPSNPALARDITVSQVAIFQGVRVGIFANDAVTATSARNAPVIASRVATVRAYVTPAAGFSARSLTAELLWEDSPGTLTVLRDTKMISGASSDGAPSSMFTFQVDAARVRSNSRWSVRVLDPSGAATATGSPASARAPRDGTSASLAVTNAPGAVRITLVPVRWTRDGSNRLPDTSPEQLQRMRSLLVALYPITAVDFTVHMPIDFGSTTLTGNVNFGSLNGVLETLRDREMPGDDVYYYALVAPDVSRAAYCGRSCVTGQSYVVSDIADASIRVGSGVGFAGEDTAWTFAHELGHLFGREHAPCSTSGSDARYPYRGAALGVWGWDPRSNTFFDPTMTTDFMGYCDPQWISDYTYRALFERASALRPGPMALSSDEANPLVHVAMLGRDGSLAYAYARRPKGLPRGSSSLDAHYLDRDGTLLGRATATVVSIADGEPDALANVFVADAFAGATRVTLHREDGAVFTLALPSR